MSDPDPTPSLDCPACHSQMQQATVDGVEFDRCPNCAGVWLDTFEKDRLLAAHAAGKVDLQGKHQNVKREKDLHCPRDHSLLIRMVDLHRPSVHFESCKICGGMFFDAGELKDLNKLSIMDRLRAALKLG